MHKTPWNENHCHTFTAAAAMIIIASAVLQITFYWCSTMHIHTVLFTHTKVNTEFKKKIIEHTIMNDTQTAV